ncbi:MAG: DEAD/DEAH box helicase [Pseudomonadota bacterium]
MAIDFSDMLDDESAAVLHPRDIFFTLPRGSAFAFPRDIQTEVLNKWFDRRYERDIVVKLNVGSGKTLVGLLMLQSALNEGVGPALWVSPNKQLARQVIAEANAVGIATTQDPRDSSYSAGTAICVINAYKLFNGKSVFGVERSDIDIGAVVVDDAHACVSTLSQQFRTTFPNTHPVYHEIIKIVAEDLKASDTPRFMEVNASDPRSFMEVPFWSWDAHHDTILGVLHAHRDDDNFQFTYPFASRLLRQSRCVIGGQRLEIEPYFPATDLVRPFQRARRRIYMTATLADDSVVVTHFGARPDEIGKPIVPTSSQSMGERMILMPQELNTDITVGDLRGLLRTLANDVNVVVIVPSKAASKEWAEVADRILVEDEVADGVEELRKGHVGLVVLVNRYDGIDLPGDACRVLAVVDLPEVTSFADDLDSDVLSDTEVNLRRQIERTEQGMGRGVRSNEDHCAVLLIGSRLIARLRSRAGQHMLTPATKAQLELTRKIAARMNQPTAREIVDVIRQCLGRDAAWTALSRKALVGLPADDTLRLDETKLALRSAFDLARANRQQDAINVLTHSASSQTDPQLKAWLLARLAAFLHPLDATAAQKALAAGHAIDTAVLKPIAGATYRQLAPATKQQAMELITFHDARFIDSTDRNLFVNTLCSDLRFLPHTSEKFEAAIDDLASFLGIAAYRPEKRERGKTDNLWALSDTSFLVIECKNGVLVERSEITKTEAGQLGQSMEWFRSRYPASRAVPIIIHPTRKLASDAEMVSGMRVIDVVALDKLKRNLREFGKQLGDASVGSNASAVAQRLEQFGFRGERFVETFTSVPK